MIQEESFIPKWASPPGDTIKILMEENEMTSKALAEQINFSLPETESLLRGEIRIDEDIAVLLSKVFGSNDTFWKSRDQQYLQDRERQSQQALMRSFPIKEMTNWGWISKGKAPLQELLRFLDIASASQWPSKYDYVSSSALFRTSPSFGSEFGSVVAWLRQGQLQAETIQCGEWSRARLEDSIPALRALCRRKDPQTFLPELTKLCAACGVALAIVRSPSGCRASGAVQTIKVGRPMILLSFRFLSDDHFWFSFFHEVGHLLLHTDRGLILEGSSSEMERTEEEANNFSSEILVPLRFLQRLHSLPHDPRAIIRFAIEVGVAPGVIVGQLQHHGIVGHHQFNRLKRRFIWKDI